MVCSSNHCLPLKPALVAGHLCGPWHDCVQGPDAMPGDVSDQQKAGHCWHVFLRRAGCRQPFGDQRLPAE